MQQFRLFVRISNDNVYFCFVSNTVNFVYQVCLLYISTFQLECLFQAFTLLNGKNKTHGKFRFVKLPCILLNKTL